MNISSNLLKSRIEGLIKENSEKDEIINRFKYEKDDLMKKIDISLKT